MRESRFSRREFLKTTLVSGVGLVGGMSIPRIVRGSKEPITLLNLMPFTGPYAANGLDSRRGVELAIKEFGGKVLDREIKVIERDAGSPADSVRRAKEVVDKEGCKFIHLGTSSSVALAVSEYCAANEVLMFCIAAADQITGANCSKFTFRWTTPTYGIIRELVPRLINENLNSFYTITSDYIFGEDLLRNTKEVLKQLGKEHLGNSYHPIGQTDYSTIITSAMATKADCVLMLNFGADRVNCHKQAFNSGLTKISKIAAAAGGGQTDFTTIGTSILQGSYEGGNYYHTIDNPLNRKVAGEFRKMGYGWMPYISANSYSQVKMILTGIKRAGTIDVRKVIPSIEDYEYEGLTGKEVYRKCDHQCIKTYYTLRLKSDKDKKDPEDFAEIIGGSEHNLTCDQTKCKM